MVDAGDDMEIFKRSGCCPPDLRDNLDNKKLGDFFSKTWMLQYNLWGDSPSAIRAILLDQTEL